MLTDSRLKFAFSRHESRTARYDKKEKRTAVVAPRPKPISPSSGSIEGLFARMLEIVTTDGR